jgi:1-acyl-sn-glycerol-3-phosphate acyltransferase
VIKRIPLRQPRGKLYRLAASVIRTVLFLTTRKDWHGMNDMPKEGGFIAVSNHVTYADPLTFAHFLYNSGYPPHYLAKAPLFDLPFIGMILRKTEQIPVHRGSVRAKDAVDTGMKVLNSGGVIAMFPEGTLTRDPDLWPMVARTGAARMALETGVPVIPVAQWGAHRLLGRYSKWPKPIPRKKVTVKVGPPIPLDDLRDRPLDNNTLREASTRIMDALTVMVEQMRGETAPAVRFDMRKKSS